ncbi:MAG: Demethylrebeccamycin-D-glucose O-methyltransferase [Bacteroidetes bacterium ADurb.Bin408]|nr:MAG: Demethylrebeccamycin-D-glucose O-methyltransferase [Bacteroidetes bacterium ADurb.Bin408]
MLHEYIMQSAGIKDGIKILDAGCGVCGPAIYFAGKRDINIDAITVSQKQADVAAENIIKAGLEHKISVRHADFHQVDKLFPENSFDLILFLESYGHAYNHEKLIKAATKVLKKGGHIYIKDYFKKDLPGSLLQRQLIRMGIKNMNNVYRYNTPDLYHTIYILRQLNFELKWLRIPDIPEWDGNKVIQKFHEKNNIAFYNGKDELYDQNNGRFIVDPYEMLFYKR